MTSENKKFTYSPGNKTYSAKPQAKTQATTSRQEIDEGLKTLTQIVEKDPKKAAEIFKSWLNKPSKIVKPKKAA
jgi:flagellar biosynthesis/type III secretory pathway M-ring protein FliF/YscJ